MDLLQSPLSPELDVAELTRLAGFAKHLGKASLRLHHRPQGGSHLTRMKGHGMEMLEVRQYHNNDEIRHIDWRVSARTGKTHTRVYAEEKEHSRLLVLQLSNKAYFGTKDTFISTRMVQLLTLIAWRTKQQNDKVGAYLQFGIQQHFLPAKNKNSHINHLLTQFSAATQLKHRYEADNPASACLALHKHNVKHQNILICSDQTLLSENELTQLRNLARYNKIHWITVQEKRLEELPVGKYQFENLAGKHTIHASKSAIESYVKKKQLTHLTLEQQLKQIGVVHHLFDLNESPVQMARHLLFCGVLS